ncbi:hypothetical protein [Candidatus Dactylopiibacterium carminicum]|uniref:hypothetical protein n=1 Tax=Candidatus Dactylopiibacterium carminicum TaxID=857335 RepID=UPI00148347BA|nr:hypothetical protein [Candidatus Dactylopiibacterium carminicum]
MSAMKTHARRHARPRTDFQPIPLVEVFRSLWLKRRQRKSQTPAPDPDWESKEPMNGLS